MVGSASGRRCFINQSGALTRDNASAPIQCDSCGRTRLLVAIYGLPTLEDAMAKGQVKSNKEAKKPKADKAKSHESAYKLSQGKSGQATTPIGGKKS